MNDMLLLIEPLIPALRRYARALVRNRANADDLVQDCLERAVSRWHQRREGEVRALAVHDPAQPCSQPVPPLGDAGAGISPSTRPMRMISARPPCRNRK